VRWLLSGHESNADRAVLDTRLLGVPRLEWQYRDLDLVHYWSSKGAPPTSLPYVLTILDGIALAGQFGETADLEGARRLARKAKAVMTLTWESAELVADVLGMDKGELIPIGAGVDGERFSAMAAASDGAVLARYGLAPEYMLYLGGWAPRKGLATLARALVSIDEKTRPVLALAGRPSEADRGLVDDFHRLGARVLGHVHSADVPVLLRHARALVLPTLAEGFGLTVIEAQASGVAVVAADLPVIRNVSGGHAVLFPPGDAARLARALLTSDQRRRELAAAGLVNARRHSWHAVAERVVSVYASALRLRDPLPESAA
jgi:glycosyltransferase involved in cell wall biosynthesis